MPTSNRRIPPKGPDDWIYRRLEELERRVDQIDNRSYPTVPIYDYNALPDDPIEGQIAIIANAPEVAASVQAFCTYEGFESATPTFPHPQDLPFGDATAFSTNDSSSFDFSGGKVRILKSGGYLVFGQILVSGFNSETGTTVAEIYDMYGVDASSNRVDGIYPTDTPVEAWVTRSMLPGGGGTTPTLQSFIFINLLDDYTVGGTRPAIWPVDMHMRLDWSVTTTHNISYSMAIMRFGS